LKFWKKESGGWAPKKAHNKLSQARIDWLIDLTDCLSIWDDKKTTLTDGELILAYANLGALVEGWLKLFYCVYYLDYIANPTTNRQGHMIEPNDLKFESLKQFSRNILWNTNDTWDLWVTKIQQRRNAIHSFNDKEIGTPLEFIKDIEVFGQFVELIDERFIYPDEIYGY